VKYLNSIASIHSGLTYRGSLKQAAAGGVAAVQMKDIGFGVLSTAHGMARLDETQVPQRYQMVTGDLVFRSRGMDNSFSLVGSELGRATTIAPMMFLRILDQNRTLPEYLHWWLNRPATRRLIDERAQGGTIRMIPAGALEDLPIDLPSPQRQRAIVSLAQLSQTESELVNKIEQKRQVWLDARLAALAKDSGE
jgi:hypothetical protein